MPTSYDPPPFLRGLPSWLSAQLARRGEELVTRALASEGLRRPHFSVLTSLAEQGPASQATLGRRLWIDRSDLHAILNDLEEDGNVRRVRDPHDGRRNVVELTRRGTATRRRLAGRVATAQEALLAGLDADDRAELVRLLQTAVEAPWRGPPSIST
jgi:DNA-binding MarR family transcriptional regulator